MTQTTTTRVLLTGATGFLGQAVLERLLSGSDDVHVTAVVRPRGSQSGSARLRQLLRKPSFRTWREAVGEERAREVFEARTSVLEGDLTGLAEITEPFDVVVHSASTVSFDPPIDQAFRTNVGGAVGLYDALRASGQDPHVIHVSTCYVGGIAKGLRPEASVDHDVDWRVEFDAAVRAADTAEVESRSPERLESFIRQATGLHGKEGPKSVARAAEEARLEWVRSRLVDHGRTRAQSLGWTDIYTFTKALGERVAEQKWAGDGHRLSIVRPSIIESALRHPFPGWIDGYKVADPLIMAYAKGALPEFPGLPDSVLDVIPVDFVVNAIVALVLDGHREQTRGAAAEPQGPAYYQVCSGASNPLPFHQMYRSVRSYFLERPLEDSHGNPIAVPEWKFPAGNSMERGLAVKEKLAAAGSRVSSVLPATARTREWTNSLHRMQTGLGSLRTYVDLYQNYTRTEMIFDDTHTRALNRSLPEGTAEDRRFDVRAIEWRDYWRDVHLPALTEMTKAYGRAKAASRKRASRTRGLSGGTDVVAVFDLEGTVASGNIITQYAQLRRRELSPVQWPGEFAELMGNAATYLKAERRDRGEFIRAFLRRYEGVSVERVRELMDGSLGRAVEQSVRPGALERIRQHREAGHRTVLVTGSLDLLVSPLAELFDDVVAGRMDQVDGVLTGYLATPPLVDEARAQWLKRYAEDHGLDLGRSYGYGDSVADASWLSLVGHPHAVNPDLPLYRRARKAHWPVEDWRRA
ncbi:HAD-IB family hydrolase [Kocuria tytonis]|uniref:HAD-IB family hydrolase n=1 Tax=Kocuria tytonis TaxID=2054280 RepID=A0A495A3M7_9MICC|nr:HAD-IB family hydrolase [Kocuria tytonis]RKQ34041.1 HAD-IB family hydrolase [Kocuria tytonis]